MKRSFTQLWVKGSWLRDFLSKKGTYCLLFLLACTIQSYGQSRVVTGVVTDASTGETLPGVNVLVKGTGSGAITGIDGNYRVEVSGPDAVLVFSFVGYVSEEIPVGNKSTIDVSLVPDLEQLDEVVVIGYGTQKKSDITGSVSVVDPKELKKVAASDVGQMLQGRVAGVAVTTDGQPGANPVVRIRGISTLGDAQPLYVVDGVPIQGSIRDINPNDIESMQVLKDASAGAIYGSRAANGVIIITTKRGRKNTPLKIDYNGYYGVDQLWQRIPVTSRANYQVLNNEAHMNRGIPLIAGNNPASPLFVDDIDTDWQEAGIELGSRENHNVSFSGGGEVTSYNVSLDYFENEGTFVGNGPSYERYSVRANTSSEKGIFKLDQSLYYASSNERPLTFEPGILRGGRPPLINDLVIAVPTMPIYDENREGGFGGTSSHIQNAISLNSIGLNHLIQNRVDVDRVLASISPELKLLDRDEQKLKYKLNLSYDRTVAQDFNFQPSFDLGYFFIVPTAQLREGTRSYTSALIENTLHYDATFGKHNLSFVGGQTFQTFKTVTKSTVGQGFERPYFPTLSNAESFTASGGESYYAMYSLLGRVTYNYGEKYLLTATLRRDGSSRFAPANRYGNFPSVAAGWRIDQEDFINMPDFVSLLKIKGSYGVLGNSNIGNYLYLPTINRNIPYHFGGQKVFGGLQTILVSERIKWEEKATANVGVEGGLFNGKIDFSAEYYDSRTYDILVPVTIPRSTGAFNNPVVNSGSLRNSGFEFELGYHKFNGDFTFDISANAYTLRNEVLSLGGENEPIYGAGSKTEVGGEVGRHFGFEALGIFQTTAEIEGHAYQHDLTSPGDIIFKDQITVDTDGDGIPDEADGVINADDRVYLGSAVPSIYYGMNFTARYKNFDFTLFASGMGGYLINSNLYRSLMHTTGNHNYHQDMLNRWTPGNTDTHIPRVIMDDPNENNRDSNREGWLQDGTHLRINTFSLGYNLPQNTVKFINNARVYVTAQNLYTFQSYKGYNPDFTSGVYEPGFDFGSFPRPRTLMLGLQFGF